jgi:hypothetical protein
MVSIAKMVMKLTSGGGNGKSIRAADDGRSFYVELKTSPGKQIVVDHGKWQNGSNGEEKQINVR